MNSEQRKNIYNSCKTYRFLIASILSHFHPSQPHKNVHFKLHLFLCQWKLLQNRWACLYTAWKVCGPKQVSWLIPAINCSSTWSRPWSTYGVELQWQVTSYGYTNQRRRILMRLKLSKLEGDGNLFAYSGSCWSQQKNCNNSYLARRRKVLTSPNCWLQVCLRDVGGREVLLLGHGRLLSQL